MARSLPVVSVDVAAVAAAGARYHEVTTAFERAVHDGVRQEALRLRHVFKNRRLARRYRLDLVEAGALRFAEGAARVPECERCTDRCCADADNEVSLRLVDVWRLVDAGLAAGIARDGPAGGAERYRDNPALLEAEARDTFQRFPTLAKQPSGACVFLDEEERCRIYPIRPLQCRRFPHRLGPDLDEVTWSSRCASAREATPAEREAAAGAVTLHHQAKVQDLVTLEHGHAILQEVDLLRFLPQRS